MRQHYQWDSDNILSVNVNTEAVTYTKLCTHPMAEKDQLPPFLEPASKQSFTENNFDEEACLHSLTIDDESSTVPSWLQYVESPFKWLPKRFSDVPTKEVISKATERIEMDEGFDTAFPFEKFVRHLTLVYEFSHQDMEGEAEAKKQLTLCDQLILEEKEKNLETYQKLRGALIQVILATKAHLLFHSGNVTEAKELAKKVQPVTSMSVPEQAAVEAMKARFFYHYRCSGAHLAVKYARRALKLAPDEPLWQVLTAEAIRRLRKFLPGTEQVSEEEVSLLERAVSKQRNARHLVLLAQAYRECGDSTFKQHRSEPDFFQSQTFFDISDMQAKAFELYKEALSLCPDHEVVNRLCGYGLLKLPGFKSDYRLAEQCLQRALELSPLNPTTIHSLGLYYYKGLMEYEKAALFCEKAGKLGNFPASLDMLRMKRLVYGNNYDPVFDFDKLLKQYGDDQTKRHEVLCQMGSYYLFFERNLTKALQYFKILMEEKAELAIMTSHKCTFLNMACKINLFECIVNEGRLLLQAESNEDNKSSDVTNIKSFLDELKLIDPNVFKIPLNKNLIDDLHKVSDDINQTYIRKKERRDSCKEKRRNSFSRRQSSIEDKITFPRRHSEGVLNLPWRSSNDTHQNRTFRNTNTSSYKQKFERQKSFEGVLPSFSELVDRTSKDEKKSPSSARRRYDFLNKPPSIHMDKGSATIRRRSSGNIGDFMQSWSFRNQNSKQQPVEGVSSQKMCSTRISESVSENSNDSEKSMSTNQDNSNANANQNWQPRRNSKPHFRRRKSWNESAISEKPKIENWRSKSDKDADLAPP